MENFGFFIYLFLLIISIALLGYNIMYTREVHRLETNVGITIPSSAKKLMKITLGICIGLSVIAGILLLIS